VNCGNAYMSLPQALSEGLISEDDIDTALRRLLSTKIKLGFFDEATAWDQSGEELVEAAAHVKLALEAAQKSMVLLKNRNDVLPLKKDIRRLYVVGPHASSSEVLLGNYYGLSGNTVTVLEGITAAVSAGTTIDYSFGQMPFQENINPMDWVTGNARNADATIVVLGLSGLIEGEEGAALVSSTKGDRLDLNLPSVQIDFLRKLRDGHDKPLIVVLTGGSPITMPEVEELADAIIFAWYPGQQGGSAVADVLFGDVSPSGRLPVTFPESVDQLPPFDDYSMAGRTYRYMTEKPLYPFGYGLSYSRFEYGDVSLSSDRIMAGDALEIEIEVHNKGKFAADEIVQVYLSVNAEQMNVPISTLVGFKRVSLQPGETRPVAFVIGPEQMQAFNDAGEKQYVRGTHSIQVGGVSPGERSEELTGQPLKTARFEIR